MRRRGSAGKGGRGAPLLAALVLAALGYVNWRVAEMELDISPAAAGVGPAAVLPEPELAPPPEPPPLADFEEIVRRPLFSVARRPPEPPQEAAATAAGPVVAAPAPALPELRLVGVAIDGAKRQALLRRPGERDAWVREGDSFAGWMLESISADGVVLGSGGRSLPLSLYPARDGAAAR